MYKRQFSHTASAPLRTECLLSSRLHCPVEVVLLKVVTCIIVGYTRTQVANDTPSKVYNYRLCRARRVVESTFGILAKKYRVYSQKLQVNPAHADIIVLAITCLHNFLRGDENLWRPGELEKHEEFRGLQRLTKTGRNAELELSLIHI